MPAVPSSPIATLSRHLESVGEVAVTARPGLLEVLDSVPDPRKKRGVRHRFGAILFVSICAVVSGAKSFAAIAEWAAGTANDTVCGMRIGAPNASTIRRALSAFTGDGFDTAIGGWLAGPLAAVRAATPGRRRGALSLSMAKRCGAHVRETVGHGCRWRVWTTTPGWS